MRAEPVERSRVAIPALVLSMAAGCTSIVGIEDFDGPGDPVDPVDSLAISGQISRDDGEFGFPLLANTPVSFHRRDGSLLASTTSDASGNYAFLVAASSDTLQGYVEVAAGSSAYSPRRYMDNALDVLASFQVTAYLSTRLEDFATFALATQTLSSGAVILHVVDGTGVSVAGATIDTHGLGTLRYHDDATNTPSADVTTTGTFGGAWVFAIPPGPITLTAVAGARRSADRTISVAAGTVTHLRMRVD
jgi:hypothetical protein